MVVHDYHPSADDEDLELLYQEWFLANEHHHSQTTRIASTTGIASALAIRDYSHVVGSPYRGRIPGTRNYARSGSTWITGSLGDRRRFPVRMFCRFPRLHAHKSNNFYCTQ